MTNSDGGVLKQCHTKMALMNTAQQSVGQQVGTLDGRVEKLVVAVDRLTVSVSGMQDVFKGEVLPAIASFPAVVEAGIKRHEKTDPVHSAVAAKTRRDVTQKFSTSRSPLHPVDVDSDPGVIKEKIAAHSKIWTAVGGLAIAFGTWAATYFFG